MSTEMRQGNTTEQSAGELSLLEEIVQATRLSQPSEAYSITKKGVEALIAQLLRAGDPYGKVSKAVLDDMIAEIDRKLSRQMDEILHHAQFQKLESSWRSLHFMVDRTDFRENNRIKKSCTPPKMTCWTISKMHPRWPNPASTKLSTPPSMASLAANPSAPSSATTNSAPVLKTSSSCRIWLPSASMSHAPFIAATAPQFFGCDDYTALPNL